MSWTRKLFGLLRESFCSRAREFWTVGHPCINEINMTNQINVDQINAKESFITRLGEADCIFDAMSNEDLRYLKWQYSPTHVCYFQDIENSSKCIDFVPTWKNEEGFMTYPEYLTSAIEKEVLIQTVYKSNEYARLIFSVKGKCNIFSLLDMLGMRKSDSHTAGLVFWRLFKRLFYMKYKRPIPRCIWRSVADVFDKGNHHPGIMEDLVMMIWKGLHTKIEWEPIYATHHKKIFQSTGEYQIFGYNGLDMVWSRNQLETIPRYRAPRAWFEAKVIKRQRTKRNVDNEPHMFTFLSSVTQAEAERRILNGVKNIEEASEVAKDVVGKTSIDIADFSEVMRTASENCKRATETCWERADEMTLGLKEMCESLVTTAKSLDGHVDELSRTAKEELIRIGSEFAIRVGNVGHVVEEGTKGLYRMLGHKTLLVCEAFCLYVTRKYLPRYLWYFLLAQSVIRWFGLADYLAHLADLIHSLIPKYFSYGASEQRRQFPPGLDNPAHAEEGENCQTLLAGIVLAATGIIVYKSVPKGNQVEKFMKTLDGAFYLNRGMEHLPKLFDKISELMERALQFFAKEEVPDNDLGLKFAQHKNAYAKWSARVSELNSFDAKSRLEKDTELQSEVVLLRDEANVYVELFSDKRWPGHMKYTFNQAYRTVVELADRAEMVKSVELFRFDPYCVWISGKPRAGKSFLATEICRDLARVMNESLMNCTYARGQSKHWDGYRRQPVAYFDDFGQWKGDLATERMSEFIACRSNHPFITPQADLADKGRPFVSKALVITSNFAYCDAMNLVHDVNAVHSRRHMVIDVQVHEAYMDKKTGLPDIFAIQQASKNFPGEYRHLTCWLMPPLPNVGQKEGPFTYEEIRSRLLKEFEMYYELQMNCIDTYNDEVLRDLRIRHDISDNSAHAIQEGDKVFVELEDFKDFPELQDLIKQYFRKVVKNGKEMYEVPDEIYKMIYWFDCSPDRIVPKAEFIDIITEEVWEFVGRFFAGVEVRMQSIYLARLSSNPTVKYKMEEDLTNFVKMTSGYEELRGYWDRFVDSLPTWRRRYEAFLELGPIKKLREHMKELAVIAGVAAMGVTAYKLLCDTAEPKADFIENDPEMAHPSGDARTAKQSKVRVVRRDNAAHAVSDSNTYDVLHNRFKRHLYWVKAGLAKTLGLAFNGSNLLVPHHLVANCKSGDEIIISGPNSLDPISFAYDINRVKRLGDDDAVVIRDIARLPPAPVLSKYFIRDRDLAKYRKFEGVILARDLQTPDYLLMPCQVQEVNSVAGLHRHHRFGDGERYYVREGWKHNAPTQRGMCMAPVFACGKRYERKAVGMHISGLRDEPTGGLALLVTEEMLLEAVSPMAFVDDDNEGHALALAKREGVSTMIGTGYITYGRTDPGEGEFAATKTSLRPSKIFDMVRKHVTEPAILSRHDPRNVDQISPFRNALRKYEVRTKAFHPMLREVAKQHLLVEHMQWKPQVPTDEISYEEVVNGCLADGYKALEMDSSPGIPWKKSRPIGEVGKKFLFEEYELPNDTRKLYRMKPDLEKAVVKALKQLQQGIRPPALWAHCLKDERKKMESIAGVKTRIFTMAPVHITLACRALTLHFTAAFYANMGRSYSAVGVDPHSGSWTMFMQKLRKISHLGGDGDYGKYDGTLDPDLIMDAMDLIADWTISTWGIDDPLKPKRYHVYGSKPENDVYFTPTEYKRALRILGVEFTHTTQIVFDLVHRKVQGNPSGNVLTVVLNTIVGAMYLRIAYLDLKRRLDKDIQLAFPRNDPWVLMPSVNFPSLRDYDREVKDWIYGDDNGYAISPTIVDWFNPKTLSDYFAEHGITYTTADKSGEEQALKSLTELRFLKRGWKEDDDYPSVYRAPIDVDTIYELTNWIRECPDEDEQLETQVEGALREAWAHGKEFYVNFLAKCNAALRTVGMKEFANEYDMQTEHWRQSVLMW